MKLQRHSDGPILKPNVFNDWEALNVFNCAVIHHGGLFHMLYRAQGLDYVSRIGYAVSSDGISWNRLQKPVLAPSSARDARGVEDPRLTLLENRFYLAYTAYGRSGAHVEIGAVPAGTTPMLAVSDNLIHWEIIGPLVEEEDNKDHLLFPAKIGGRYLGFHRRPPGIWLAASSDLRSWGEHRQVMAPRPGCWDGKRIGAGGPPIETEEGWLTIYHGYDDRHVYCLGTALLDRDDPSRVLKRPPAPILSPEETWEVRGDVPNVVFSCANPVVAGTVYVYYGAADRVIGLATVGLEELLEWTLRHG